ASICSASSLASGVAVPSSAKRLRSAIFQLHRFALRYIMSNYNSQLTCCGLVDIVLDKPASDCGSVVIIGCQLGGIDSAIGLYSETIPGSILHKECRCVRENSLACCPDFLP